MTEFLSIAICIVLAAAIFVLLNHINELERRITLLEFPFLSDEPPSEFKYTDDKDEDWSKFPERKK